MQISSRREKLWTKDFMIALFSYFFLFMSVTLFFLLPLFLKQLTPSKTRVGLIMGVHSFMAIVIRPFFGRLIDIKGGKKISIFGISLLILTIPLFHFIRDAGIFPVFLRALTGMGWGMSMTATMAICSDLAPLEKLAHSMGIIGVAGLIASALGPLVGEEIVNRFGFSGLFHTSTAFLFASLLCMLMTRETIKFKGPSQKSRSSPWAHLPLISLLIIGSMPIFHGAVRSTIVYFIALFGSSIGIQRIGMFFVTFSLAAILARFFIGDLSDRYGRKKVIFPAASIISLNAFLIAMVKSPVLFVLTGFIGGFGQGLIFPALSAYVIDIIGRKNKGLALSLYLSLFDIGMGLGSPFFGWISDIFGYRKMYVFAGLLLTAINIIFTLKAPKLPSPAK